MSRTALQELFISMEDGEVVEDQFGSDSMEGDLLEVEELRQEAETSDEVVEDLETIAEGLEAIQVSVEASIVDGGTGLSEQAAQFLTLAVRPHMQRLGMESVQIVPSLESFGGASGQVSATQISLEEIKGTIARIWNAIKSAVMRAIQAMKDFFAKIFQSVDKVIARADALEKQVNGLGGKKAEGKIKPAGMNNLAVGGKTDVGAVKTGLNNILKVGASLNQDYIASADKFYEMVATKSADTAQLNAEAESAIEAANNELKSSYSKITSITTKLSSVEMSGGYTLVSSGTNSEGGAAFALPRLQKSGKAVSEGGEMDPLSEADMKVILATVKNICKMMQGKKAAIESLSKSRKDALDKAKKLADAAEGNKLGKAWDTTKVRFRLNMLNRSLETPVSQFAGRAFQSCRAALALVEKSTAAYK